jgi:pimeloyl-ACP methyl ester carboxylesterase
MEIERGLVLTDAGYVHYRAVGSGKTVVVLHINQQSSALCVELVTALSARYRAIAFDYPGHGMSDHVFGDPTIASYAGWLVEAIEKLGVSNVSLVGEAIGAAIAIEMANLSDRVDKLLLVNCPYYHDRSVARESRQAMSTDLRPSDASGFPVTRDIEFMLARDPVHSPMRPSQSWMDRMNVAQLQAGRDRWQAIGALHRYDIPARLACVQQPVLLLMGEYFQYTPFIRELTACIQNGRCDIIPEGRFCMTWERAEDIARKTMELVS